jgi:UPF0716 protein FxsA
MAHDGSLQVVIVALLPIVWLIAELFVAIKVAEAIGVLEMILLLLVSWPLGGWALRSQGRAAWRRLRSAVEAGHAPGREVLDGVLILIGGLLLIVPGFISDVVAVIALLPPTRALLRGRLSRHLQRRFVIGASRSGRGVRSYDVDSTASRAVRPYDVDSTATDVDQSQLQA